MEMRRTECAFQKSSKALWLWFEGVSRQATLYKNRNRDTAWFGIIDKDWRSLKKFGPEMSPGKKPAAKEAEGPPCCSGGNCKLAHDSMIIPSGVSRMRSRYDVGRRECDPLRSDSRVVIAMRVSCPV